MNPKGVLKRKKDGENGKNRHLSVRKVRFGINLIFARSFCTITLLQRFFLINRRF